MSDNNHNGSVNSNHSTRTEERRALARMAYDIVVLVGPPKGKPSSRLTMLNLSVGGCFIACEKISRIDARFSIMIQLPNEDWVIMVPEVEIVYNLLKSDKSPLGFGARFVDLSLENVEKLSRALATLAIVDSPPPTNNLNKSQTPPHGAPVRAMETPMPPPPPQKTPPPTSNAKNSVSLSQVIVPPERRIGDSLPPPSDEWSVSVRQSNTPPAPRHFGPIPDDDMSRHQVATLPPMPDRSKTESTVLTRVMVMVCITITVLVPTILTAMAPSTAMMVIALALTIIFPEITTTIKNPTIALKAIERFFERIKSSELPSRLLRLFVSIVAGCLMLALLCTLIDGITANTSGKPVVWPRIVSVYEKFRSKSEALAPPAPAPRTPPPLRPPPR